jgi:amino acid transporter
MNSALWLTILLVVNIFLGGISSIAVTIRTVFALARDDGFPFSKTVSKVHLSTCIPIYALTTVFVMDSGLLLLQLVSTTAFVAVTSISTIGYQVSYAIPILLRITSYRNKFKQSAFNLGRYSTLCGIISCIFLFSTSILFTLPVEYPVTWENFNYTIVVFAGVSVVSCVNWMVSARNYYKGVK